MSSPDPSFIQRIQRCIAEPGPDAPRNVRLSILAQAARLAQSAPLGDEVTAPTGFDPAAASLFEGAVECAFLVATADAPLDPTEDAVLRAIIGIGCDGKSSREQTQALIDELRAVQEREGAQERIDRIAALISNRDHQHEVLRIAALMAHASGAVRDDERALLETLAHAFALPEGAVSAALHAAEIALRAA